MGETVRVARDEQRFLPVGGVWWKDTERSRKAAGFLTRDGDSWSLALVGSLASNERDFEGYAIVPGDTLLGWVHGKAYTLQAARLRTERRNDLVAALNSALLHDWEESDNQPTQGWDAHRLLDGVHAQEDHLFESAVFQMSGLPEFWRNSGVSRLGTTTHQSYEQPAPTRATLLDGYEMSITTRTSGSAGIRGNAFEEHVVVVVEKAAGFTLADLEQEVILPLRALVRVCLDRETDYYDLRLRSVSVSSPTDRDPYDRVDHPVAVDPQLVPASAARPRSPGMSPFTSDTDAIDLSRLLTWWIEFAKTSPVPIYVAENRYPATLEAGVVQVVNAAETLHRALHADGSDDATAAEVREVLKSAGMYTSKRRADIYRALVKWTPLERRLRELGSAGGDDFAAWLLDGQLRNWAIVAARVRNLLAHGGTSKSRVEQDLAAQAGILEVTRAVIVARLLIAAGVPADERIFSRDRRFRAIVNQRLADWRQLAEALDLTSD